MAKKFLNEDGVKQILQTLKSKFVLLDNGERIKIGNNIYAFPFNNGVEIEGENIDISVTEDNKLLFSTNGKIEYFIRPDENPVDFAAVYKLYKIENGITSVVDCPAINIPYDYVLKDVQIKVCNTNDIPVTGYIIGDKYVDFEINTRDNKVISEHIYVNLKEIMLAYTAGNGIDITNNIISVKVSPNGGIITNNTGIAANINNNNGLTIEDNLIKMNVVTQAINGAMSSQDKIKLDDLEKDEGIPNNDIDSLFA